MKYACNSSHEYLRRRGESFDYFNRYARREMKNNPGDGIQAQITIAQAAYALCAAYAPHLIELLPELEVAYAPNRAIYDNARQARRVGHVAWLYGQAAHCHMPNDDARQAERELYA